MLTRIFYLLSPTQLSTLSGVEKVLAKVWWCSAGGE